MMMNESTPQRLESKQYNFIVDGTMPVLNFELTSGGRKAPEGMSKINQIEKQTLRLELYAPISGEVFEAKTQMGRIEVDNDGTVTYFSNAAEKLSFSLFLGKSITLTFNRKTSELFIRTPSKITSIQDNRMSVNQKGRKKKSSEPITDEIKLVLD
jgi:hypothetical protein